VHHEHDSELGAGCCRSRGAGDSPDHAGQQQELAAHDRRRLAAGRRDDLRLALARGRRDRPGLQLPDPGAGRRPVPPGHRGQGRRQNQADARQGRPVHSVQWRYTIHRPFDRGCGQEGADYKTQERAAPQA